MIANYSPNRAFKIPEKFLADKLLELFFNKTLDSHRAKLNNPRWVLIELHQILLDWDKRKIKAFDKTIKPVILETIKYIEDINLLHFGVLNVKYYKELLGNASEKNYNQLMFATKFLVDENVNYTSVLFDNIEKEINYLNSNPCTVENLDKLSKYLDQLATDLINDGYAKGYLYSISSRLFSEKMDLSFSDALNEFRKAISREKETFKVVFRINKLGGGNKRINIKSDFELDGDSIVSLSKINTKAKEFFSKQGQFYYFLSIEVLANDYLSAIEIAKKRLFTLIDSIHMGYPDNPFDFHKKCLVIGSRKPELANTHPVTYVTDGSYKNNEELYELLLSKTRKIQSNSNIENEASQKIVSAFRHLRLGRDADELEQKFLNYWIGLEYIFSNYDVNDSTIVRLKEYFIYSHSVAYMKRNLKEFHNDIKRLKLQTTLHSFGENMEYLQKVETYDFIINTFFEAFPLLAYRAHKYKQLIIDRKKICDEITKHKCNLEWHLTRCYRIRNEIVHDAAIHLNIESITGNLKYYLTYILNGLLDYLDTIPNNISLVTPVSLSDYFTLQEIKYRSIEKSDFKLELLMAEKSATEIFSA